jgi:hypothetical protein
MGQSDLFHWFNGGRLDLPKRKGRHHRLHSQVRAPTGKHLLPVRTKWKIHVNYDLSEARDECCHSPDSGGTLPPSLPRNRTRCTICHPLGRQPIPDYAFTSEPIGLLQWTTIVPPLVGIPSCYNIVQKIVKIFLKKSFKCNIKTI